MSDRVSALAHLFPQPVPHRERTREELLAHVRSGADMTDLGGYTDAEAKIMDEIYKTEAIPGFTAAASDVLPVGTPVELPRDEHPKKRRPKMQKSRARLEVREVRGKQLQCLMANKGWVMVGFAMDDVRKDGRCTPVPLFKPRGRVKKDDVK